MKLPRLLLLSFAALVSTAQVTPAQQALPTAARSMQLSAFGGLSGVYTGLSGGRNLSFTAGSDLGLVPFHGVRPAVEVRGTVPMHGGQVASEKAIFFGGKFEFLINHSIRPYGDFLYGRGQINYERGGYLFGNLIYLQTGTDVLSPGAGFDYDLTDHFALKLDGQFQRWSGAPTASGNIYSKVGTVAVVYQFNFGGRRLP